MCKLIKARLSDDATYSTEMPLAHAYIYARNFNRFVMPFGYVGLSLEKDILAFRPDVGDFTLESLDGIVAPSNKKLTYVDLKCHDIATFFSVA